MSRTYSIIEPHPTVPKSGAYLHVGRGGAGNVKKFKPSELSSGPDATGPASRTSLLKPAPRLARTGRGGAGNYSSSKQSTEEGVFQFDEEMLKKRDAQPAPVYHVGRGGAGNLFWERPAGASERKDSTSSSESRESQSERISALRRNSGGVLSIFSRRSA